MEILDEQVIQRDSSLQPTSKRLLCYFFCLVAQAGTITYVDKNINDVHGDTEAMLMGFSMIAIILVSNFLLVWLILWKLLTVWARFGIIIGNLAANFMSFGLITTLLFYLARPIMLNNHYYITATLAVSFSLGGILLTELTYYFKTKRLLSR